MTFLCTYDGKVEPGYQDGHARTIERDGSTYYHWPQPWYFDCDFCGRRFPYGCVAISDPCVQRVLHGRVEDPAGRRRPAYGVQLYDHIVEREAKLAALLGGKS
jgi:hypothetical protein